MKKKLLFVCLIGLMSISSAHAKCDGGTEITNTAGTTFCKSNVKMNWWSAAAWCKENDLHLATMYEMCPNWDGNAALEKCPELNGNGDVYAWSATASGSENAFSVNLSYGHVLGPNRKDSSKYAFCR